MPHQPHIVAAAPLLLWRTGFTQDLREIITGLPVGSIGRLTFLLAGACFAWVSTIAPAAELRGTVADAGDKTAKLTVDGQLAPNTGDNATIFFKLPGSEDEVLVANGHVTAVDGGTATVAIDKSFGAVQKDQLARIVSNAPKPKAESSQSKTAQAVAELYKQLQDLYAQRRIHEGIAVAERLIELNPRDGSAYVNRAIFQLGDDPKGNAAKAVADVDRALVLGCDRHSAYALRGRAQAYLGNLRASVEDSSKAIELGPNDSAAYAVRAAARFRLGENEAALEDVSTAMRLDPKRGEAYMFRGAYFASIGAVEPAEADWNKAITLDSSLQPQINEARRQLAKTRAKAAQPTKRLKRKK